MKREYQPGDMAHPVEQRSLTEQARDAIRDPDNWVSAFMLAVVLFVCVGLIVR